MARKNLAVVAPEWTPEQADALNGLHEAMQGFANAVFLCNATGIPLADAFAAIGVEVPLMLRPALNALADKLPKVSTDT